MADTGPELAHRGVETNRKKELSYECECVVGLSGTKEEGSK